MAVEVPQNEEISGGKNGGKKESVLPSVGEELTGGAYTLMRARGGRRHRRTARSKEQW